MKNSVKNTLAGLAIMLVMLTGYLYSQDFRPVVYKAAENSVAKIVASSGGIDDDFKLLFCGTGSPSRSPDRGQPCTALIAAGKLFLFDAGEGAIAKLTEFNAPLGQLHSIFLTHLHSDHISGVAEVLHNTWLYGRLHIVETVGPPGTLQIIKGFEHAYSLDLHERIRVLGPENLDSDTAFRGARDVMVEGSAAKVVYQDNGLVIRAFLVTHPDWPQAYGYRIEYRDKVIVISGDTRPSEGITRYAKGADILIHEALNTEIFDYVGEQMEAQGGPMPKDRIARIASAHTSTLALAEIAEKTEVGHLIITHLIPAMPANWAADKFFTSGMSDIYHGKIIVARDGQSIDVLAL